MRTWLHYGTSRLQVVPHMPGTPVYRDATLPYVYNRLRMEDKIEGMFCGERKNQDSFVSYFDRIKTAQIACRVNQCGDLEPVGITWCDLPRGQDGARACQCGMAYFGDVTRTWDARNLARLALAYTMIEMKIDVYHGVQLEDNFPARNFALKLGFEECGVIPSWHYRNGELVGARVMMLRAATFIPAFEEWHAKQKALESMQNTAVASP